MRTSEVINTESFGTVHLSPLGVGPLRDVYWEEGLLRRLHTSRLYADAELVQGEKALSPSVSYGTSDFRNRSPYATAYLITKTYRAVDEVGGDIVMETGPDRPWTFTESNWRVPCLTDYATLFEGIGIALLELPTPITYEPPPRTGLAREAGQAQGGAAPVVRLSGSEWDEMVQSAIHPASTDDLRVPAEVPPEPEIELVHLRDLRFSGNTMRRSRK